MNKIVPLVSPYEIGQELRLRRRDGTSRALRVRMWSIDFTRTLEVDGVVYQHTGYVDWGGGHVVSLLDEVR